MATGTLTGQTIANTYKSLLKITGTTAGGETLHATTQNVIEDGDGNPFPYSAAQDALLITSTNRLEFGTNANYVYQVGSNVLGLVAGSEIDLTATAIDINGTGDVSGTLTVGGVLTVNNGAVFNEASADVDFRVESNGNANMIFVDGGNDRVGIGTNAPQTSFDVMDGDITLTKSNTNIVDGTDLGSYKWYADDNSSGENLELAAQIQYVGTDTWDSSTSEANLNFMLKATADALPTTKMTVTYDGKVGVATDSPDTTLEVVGSFAANGPSSTFVTMSSGDTSPDISTGNIFKTHSDGVTIDQFDGGICGQIITIISGGATVYDVTSSELNGGTTNITTAAGDVTMWVCESATDWHLLSWMDLSIDLSSGGF